MIQILPSALVFSSVQLRNTHCYLSKENEEGLNDIQLWEQGCCLCDRQPFQNLQERTVTGSITCQMRYRSPIPSNSSLHTPLGRQIPCTEEGVQPTVYRILCIAPKDHRLDIEWTVPSVCLLQMSMQWREIVNMVREKIESRSTASCHDYQFHM